MNKLPEILPAPKHPSNLSKSAKWLSGEGAGSWFVIEESDSSFHYKISRFSEKGNLECKSNFTANKKVMLAEDYSISYPSHCAAVTVIQGLEKISFKNKNEKYY